MKLLSLITKKPFVAPIIESVDAGLVKYVNNQIKPLKATIDKLEKENIAMKKQIDMLKKDIKKVDSKPVWTSDDDGSAGIRNRRRDNRGPSYDDSH